MKLIVLICVILMSSCIRSGVVKQPILIHEERNDLYELTIHESGTKTDAFGNVQCTNYAISQTSDDELSIYGSRFISALANLLESEEKHIELEDNELKNLFIDITYKSLSDTPYLDKKLISDKLLQQYELSLMSEENLVEGYDLQIADLDKLNQHKSSFQEQQSYKYRNKTLTMPGITLNILARALNENMNENIATNLGVNTIYQLELKVNNFENLKRQLEEKYGLILSKKKVKVVKYTVERNSPT